MNVPVALSKKQAVDELRVFLRTMCIAQRRWSREIASCESQVRKQMMEEDQCRERLRREVLRGAYDSLKYLVTTDLISSSQVPHAKITPEAFLYFDITPDQVRTPFAVYVMGRLLSNPSRVERDLFFSFPSLIAEYQAGWAMVSPAVRQEYERLAVEVPAALKELREKAGLDVVPSNSCVNDQALPPLAVASKTEPTRRPTPRGRKGKKVSPAAVADECASVKHQQDKKTNATQTAKKKRISACFAAPWEKKAFKKFLRSSFLQMKVSLEKEVVKKRQQDDLTFSKWTHIAQAEWSVLSEEQKKLYLS